MSWYEEPPVEEKRELYKAMRSAHDGICPLCAGKTRTITPRGGGLTGYECTASSTACGFRLTAAEVGEIKTWHGQFHRDLGPVLERWREARA